MHTEIIKADTIDEAVKRILQELKEDDDDTTGSVRHNVIYFDGWDGLGASAVLRAVGQRLSAGREFSQIIHIDCSKWESRRAVQRALAVQLQLPAHVIGMFDAQDEEDDYRGLGQGSRLEIPKVSREIYEHVQKQLGQRFLVIFNNGSCEEIDLESFGFPLSGYSRNKALWSFQGGFRLYPRMKVDMALQSKTVSSTDVFLSAASINLSEYYFSKILRHEAEELALGMINTGSIDWPAAAAGCFLYTMRLCGMGGHLIDYDLATHGCNYWICDGTIELQQGDVVIDDVAAADTLWLSCDALKREMRLDADYHQSPQLPASLVVRRLQERMAYWTSPAYGTTLIKDGRIPKGMFQQYDKLCVLKLSACRFSLTSPPFLCCHSLRFLWLDRCQEESSSKDDGAANEEDIRRCFQKLWVLDVRYSSSKFLSEKMMDFMVQLKELHVMGQEELDMDMLQGRLHNIRKLRVTKSKTNSRKRPYLLSGKHKMEHLELSGNGGSMKSLSVESSSCSSLDTVIIDGCASLEEISLKGWAKPKNLLLSGSFPVLCSLDLSGAAVKTLDLSAVIAPKLDELLLLDCVKLIAILWPKAEGRGRGKTYLGKLRIDTTQKLGDDTGSNRSHAGCSWYICVREARLLGLLEHVKDYFGDNGVHLDISTRIPSALEQDNTEDNTEEVDQQDNTEDNTEEVDQQDNTEEVDQQDNYYATKFENIDFSKNENDIYFETEGVDVDASVMQQLVWDGGLTYDSGMMSDSRMMSTCPPAPGVSSRGCYMHIEDTTDAAAAGGNNEITIPGFICDAVKILHVHDSLFVTRIIPAASVSNWDKLEWCRVERCPKLECVFITSNYSGACDKLRTIWVSHLTNARCVMELHYEPSFSCLTSLHLYCCPRLVDALPWSSGLKKLETLEIMWCGDLRMVFNLQSSIYYDIRELEFPKLKHLRLHELPEMFAIVSMPWSDVPLDMRKKMLPTILAPNLKTVKIRGCWNLLELPMVRDYEYGSWWLEEPTVFETVSCDCEKEWWDKLLWVHSRHRSNYEPVHARHYKMQHRN